MKTKATITLEETLLAAVDRAAGVRGRSRLIEKAIVYYFKEREAGIRGRRDREIIDRNADWLNDEMKEILSYQAEP
jgi:metal-responsive CopG/Arc/MetJ family transcriptional regulator